MLPIADSCFVVLAGGPPVEGPMADVAGVLLLLPIDRLKRIGY